MWKLLLPAAFAAAALAQTADFVRDVQPVLTARCLACHSGEGAQAGLKIHTRDELLAGGKSGPAIVPGKADASLLVERIEGRKGMRMPPSGPPLEPAEIDRIRQWIDQGARFEGRATPVAGRVAPLAPRMPPVPAGAAANPIDRFIDSYLAQKKLPAPPLVSDALFARRVWLDLHGLPPPPEALAAFLASHDKDKRTRLIDRLLAERKPYAEHWISFWNDLLRNDEGVIYHGERKSISTWLLGALEQNVPYDAMVRALLDPPAKTGPEGFLVGVTWRGVVSASQVPPMQAAQNAAQVFLGINLKCAACHDSFINRWKLRDTYGLAGLFSEEPLELARCDVKLGGHETARFLYSDFGVKFDDSAAARRKAAADWFVHRENGRFSRTLVNRYWRQLFGRGIVEPPDDMDGPPWSEDLLDWLASDFSAHGYDLRHLLRQITTSRAYQSEAVREVGESRDYVFRGPRLRRLSAEQFSDTISAVTGDWRLHSPRTENFATYSREWRLKSDPLSRALGRPIR
ncbi:MAG TPA: DUF1549 domain-containing protein, partial [Beijerinckiaceae bacterium]|nr:DUF1549 domain-containing protein [Beijerinckiaceae bacterium]